ncbi:MAG: DUF4097 family beta strand repeat-containing protein [Tuberibacillus sp.]
MRKLAGILFIVIGVLILAGVAIRFFPVTTKIDEKNVSLDGTAQLVIDLSSENVEMIPEERSDMKVELSRKGLQDADIISKQEGDKTTISVKKDGWHWFFNWGSKVKMYIPNDYASEIDLRLHSGNLTFHGDDIQLKKLSLDVVSGNIDLTDLEVEKMVSNVHSGNVHLVGIKAKKEAALDVRSGNTKATHFEGPLSIDTRSGNVTVQMDSLKSLAVNTRSGNVKLDLPNDAGFKIKAKLDSGSIHNSFSLDDSLGGSNYLMGTHGDGKANITINGRSGNVKIY